MLKRICDRCGAEIPVEQTMDERDLILRRLNDKPFDLCIACQNELRSWFDLKCRNCHFYDPFARRCRALNTKVDPDFWCKHGKRDIDDSGLNSASIGGADDKRNGDS